MVDAIKDAADPARGELSPIDSFGQVGLSCGLNPVA